MPVKTFFLSSEKDESITVKWKGGWKQTTITSEGNEIGAFKNQKELKQGKEFQLDENRKLSVKLKGLIYPDLELLINGNVIEGSPADPKMQLKQVFNFAVSIGGLNVFVGLLSELLMLDFLLNIGIGIESIIYGGLIILLAFGVKKKSMISLVLIVGLIILDIIGSFWLSMDSDVNPTNGVVVKVFFLIFLFKGFGAIKKIKIKQLDDSQQRI